MHLRASLYRSLYLASGALALALSACGPGSQPGPTSAAPAATKPPAAAASTVVVASPAAAASPGAAASPAAPAPSAAVTISGSYPGQAPSLNGAGGTFPAPLYQKWFDQFASLADVKVNYQAIGSGGGIKGIQDQTVDFGASDAPMSDTDLAAAKGGAIFHIPTALGGVVPTYNLPTFDKSTRLKFTGDTVAGIYLGDITRWNDPKLVADNPALANVNEDIVVVHRSDGSGTTYCFADYLSAVSPAWQQKVGKSTSVNWPTGLGGSGNAGVAGQVQQTPYSIGYVDVIYAVQNDLAYGQVKNQAGNFVDATLDNVTAAAASAGAVAPDLRFSIVNAPGSSSYPISTATWLLVYQTMTDQAKALSLTRVLWWVTHDGQQVNNSLEFATVPPAITAKSEQFIREIAVEGKPVFPGK